MNLEEIQKQLRQQRQHRAKAGHRRLDGVENAALRIALGADHGGYALKETIKHHLLSHGIEVEDVGTHDATSAVDYPDLAVAVAEKVRQGDCALGIVVDAAGLGSCMAANKVPGVRAATCHNEATARNSREHNDANVLVLGSHFVHPGHARRIVSAWLETPHAGGRHARRVDKINALDARRGGPGGG
jgi:ribose 5-phosphate isomerase B